MDSTIFYYYLDGLKLGNSLFFAIKRKFYKAIEKLLDEDPQTELKIEDGGNSMFEPGLTPVMLAARKNNFKILLMLHK